jgi:hypothetical protein
MCGANGSIKRGSCMIITISFGSIDVTTPNSKLKLCHWGGLFCSAQGWISCCLIQHYFESYIYLFTMTPPIVWLWDLSKQTLLQELDQAGLPTEGNKRDLQNQFSQFLKGLPASEIESIRRRVERELTAGAKFKYSVKERSFWWTKSHTCAKWGFGFCCHIAYRPYSNEKWIPIWRQPVQH